MATKDASARPTGTVVRLLQPGASDRDQGGAFVKRWGSKIADHGYTMVPSILISMQSHLRLNSSEMMVLLQILSFWWGDGLPWPGKATIAKRVGIKERQVQRVLTRLEKKKLIKRIVRRYKSGGQSSNAYDLTGLVDKLTKLEPKYRVMKKENKARQAEVETAVKVK